ncbi:MAG TPA: hypothetical protein QGH10_20320, partial [Armatimonadota bacterium]|nr:hypothetical protein [Armatimonadota bacterium]
FRYEGFYFAMLNTMYTHADSESYESYHKSPTYPDDHMGHLDIQLVHSRDARSWQRPADRSPVVPYGEPGAPDWAAIYPALNPFVIDGETWIYYTATTQLHSWWHVLEEYERDPSVRDVACGMLAKMPEDHWVSLDAGTEEGHFLCKPWGPPHEVFVNADAAGGSIEAELVTPYGEVLPGYGREDCIPVTTSGKRQELRWKNGRHPWDLAGEYRGGVLVKFYIKKAKLYSYTFTLPDPDGQLERDQLNARWVDAIKHRSDNWDRLSTEPADGLPPHAGPGPEKGDEKPGQPAWDA